MLDSILQPRLVISGAARAIGFYKDTLMAEEVSRFEDDSGSIAYAELMVPGSVFNPQRRGRSR